METSEPQYNPASTAQVSGSLTVNGVPTTTGLVGMEIDSSSGPLAVRTLPAAHIPSVTPYVFTEYVVPCYVNDTPHFSFQRDALVYFKVYVVNLNVYDSYMVYVTVCVYDNNSTPLGVQLFAETLAKNSSSLITMSFLIPSNAALGTATVYGDAYSNWPRLGGTPYVREVNATFQIVGGTYGAGHSAKVQSTGTNNYNTAFNTATMATPSVYHVYVTSSYLGQTALANTTYSIVHGPPHITGDLGGGVPPQFFKFDGKVNGEDLALFLQCYRGTAPWNATYLGDLGGGVPPKFFDYDGTVNGEDLALFLQCYRGTGPTGPVAIFTWSPTNPKPNQLVTFNASKSYDDQYGKITSYEWNFGDGSTTTVTNPIVQHTFTSPGNYTVTLTVIDNQTRPSSTSYIISP